MGYEFNKENFDKIMENFVKLDLLEQRKQIIGALYHFISIEKTLCKIGDSDIEMFYNKEVEELENNIVDEKSFLEAIYAYIYTLKNAHYNLINSLIDKIISTYDK